MPCGHSWEIFQRERAWSRESVEITAGILARKSEWIELPAAGDWLVVGEAAIGEHETDAVLTERSQWADHIEHPEKVGSGTRERTEDAGLYDASVVPVAGNRDVPGAAAESEDVTRGMQVRERNRLTGGVRNQRPPWWAVAGPDGPD